jgi:hypothetical protein
MFNARLNHNQLGVAAPWLSQAAAPATRWLALVVCALLLPGMVDAQRVNLAKFQATTASSSFSTDYPASNATDGVANNDSRWISSLTLPHTLQVQLPLAMTVGSAQVFLGMDDSQTVTNFSIQYLDNASNWVTCPGASITGNTLNERNIVFTTNVMASLFRFYSTDFRVRVKDFALYPPNGPAGWPLGTDVKINLAGFYGALADSTYTFSTTTYYPRQAVDGYVDDNSRWLSLFDTNSTGRWLQIDFETTNKIGSAHLYSGSGVNQNPVTNFTLQYRSGTNWLTIPGAVFTNNSTNAIVINFTTPVSTDSVRYFTTNTGFQRIRELLIFPANGGSNYPLGTGVKIAPRPTQSFTNYHDDFYFLVNRASGNSFVSSTNGAGEATVSSTTDQKSYQLLYNYDSDTYRIRNRASWKCLEVAGASTNDGAAIVEDDYSAMPHQLWKYQYVNGTNLVFINAWSGKAMQSTAGVVTQQPLTAGSNQQWGVLYVDYFPKKGSAGYLHTNLFSASWGYNWTAANPYPDLTPEFVFNPMNFADPGRGHLGNNYALYLPRPGAAHLLGYNEPDKYGQTGRWLDTQATNEATFSEWRALTNALLFWPRLESLDLPLVSACPGSSTSGWLAGFYDSVDARGMRSEYTAIHSYPGPSGGSASALVTSIQNTYSSFGRKVWLTEFSVVDWSGGGNWSEEDNYNWITEFIWRAESLDQLKKYALFIFTADTNSPTATNPWDKPATAPRSNFFETNGTTLTAFGEAYVAWDQDATVRDDKVYMIHNKAARHRLRCATGNSSLTNAWIRSSDASVQWVFRPAPGGRKYIVSAQDGRRLRFNGTTLDYAPVGTTGTNVEWTATIVSAATDYGWFYLDHPATSKRLQLLRSNNASNAPTSMVYSMVTNTTTTTAVNWRFVRPISPGEATAPAAVSNLQAVAGNQTVALTWNASAAADFWRYSVYRSTTNGGPYPLLATNLTATNLTDNAVTNGTTYYYVVTATDLIGYESANSNQAIATPVNPLPTTPTNIVHSVSNGMLVLNWPANYTGWLLQVQTNQLTQGIGTNWTTIFSSSNSSSIVLPVNTQNPAMFYRLKLP